MAETSFQDVAQRLGRLVGCSAVYVFPGCHEAELRHPLLNVVAMSRYRSIDCSGSPAGSVLLEDERVRALCDVAVQSGQIQWVDSMRPFAKDIESLAIVPLERPAGVLGFVLLTDSCAGAFCYGERLLLSQYVPQVAHQLEQALADMCIVPGDRQETSFSAQPVEHSLWETQSLSEHAQKQQQIKELDRLKNEFISMVGHELRTPLTAIKGYAVLLKAYGLRDGSGEGSVGEMSPARQREYVDSIMEQTSHLEVLIGDLLDISRIQAGRISLRNSEVNFVPLCQRVVRLVEQRADQEYAGRYKFACSLPSDLPFIWADADRLRQILTNLLENAVKYSPDGGLIEVLASTRAPGTASPTGDLAVDDSSNVAGSQGARVMYITVRDHGIGIAQEQLSQLFKPFARLENPLTAAVPGAGLGLYISRKLVEAMGGKMSLSSSEGMGTSMTFSLPLLAAHTIAGPGFVPMSALTPS